MLDIRKLIEEFNQEKKAKKDKEEVLGKYDAVGVVESILPDKWSNKILRHCERRKLAINKIYCTSELDQLINDLIPGQIVVAQCPRDLGKLFKDRIVIHDRIIARKCHLHIRFPPYKSEEYSLKSSRDSIFGVANVAFDLLTGYESSDEEVTNLQYK